MARVLLATLLVVLAGLAAAAAPPQDWRAVIARAARRCNVPILEREAFIRVFEPHHKGRHAVILRRDAGVSEPMRRAMAAGILLERLNASRIVLTSAEGGKRDSTLGEALRLAAAPLSPATPASEAWLWTGEAAGAELSGLLRNYVPPPTVARDEPSTVWGVAPAFAGAGFSVPAHPRAADAAAGASPAQWVESIHGIQLWTLLPPGTPAPPPGVGALQWAVEQLEPFIEKGITAQLPAGGDAHARREQEGRAARQAQEELVVDASTGSASLREDVQGSPPVPLSDVQLPLTCAIGPGQLLYIPPGWSGAPLHLAPHSVFVTTQTLERQWAAPNSDA